MAARKRSNGLRRITVSPRVPVPQQAIETIQQAITSGKLPPSAPLPAQRELAQQLGVSRASLREALSVLETLGFLRVKPRQGVFVAGPEDREQARRQRKWRFASRYSERDVFELRYSIEASAAEIAALAGDDAFLADLTRHVAAMRQAAKRSSPEQYARADFAFHNAIVRSAGNKLLIDVHDALGPLLIETQRLPLYRPAEYEEPVKEHELIIDALRRKDPRLAALQMHRHLNRAARRGKIKLRT